MTSQKVVNSFHRAAQFKDIKIAEGKYQAANKIIAEKKLKISVYQFFKPDYDNYFIIAVGKEPDIAMLFEQLDVLSDGDLLFFPDEEVKEIQSKK